MDMPDKILLPYNCWFDRASKTLSCGWNAGLFSNLSVTLGAGLRLQEDGQQVQSIDFSQGFSLYRDGELNLHHRLFNAPLVLGRMPARPQLGHHSRYFELDHVGLSPYVNGWFQPCSQVLAFERDMVVNAGIQTDRTLAVFYRGTDKGSEATLADPIQYVRLARRLLGNRQVERILIQTDQRQVRDLFMSQFPDQCTFFSELPVTDGKNGIHSQANLGSEMSKTEMAQRLVAAVHCIAGCHTVVQHTGNMALWVALWRGSAERLWQFDVSSRLVNPNGSISMREHFNYAFKQLVNRLRYVTAD